MVVVCVIGCGQMGVRIATEFALNGNCVHLYDVNTASLENVPKRIEDDLNDLLIDGLVLDKTLSGEVKCIISLDQAVLNAQLIIECIIEDFNVKAELLRTVSRLAMDNAIITTNTLNLDVAQLADYVRRKERFVALRFLYPVYFITDVEITQTEFTSNGVIERLRVLLGDMGKTLFFRKGKHALLLTEADIQAQKLKRQETLKNQMYAPNDIQPETNAQQRSNTDAPLTSLPCAICLEMQRNSIYRPCNHLVSCFQCSRKLFERNSVCPVCRETICEIIKIFIP